MLVIGTLDTKGVEIEFLAEAIASPGRDAAPPRLLDRGGRGDLEVPGHPPRGGGARRRSRRSTPIADAPPRRGGRTDARRGPRADRGAVRRRPKSTPRSASAAPAPTSRARPSSTSRSGSRSWSSRRSPPASASSSPTSGSATSPSCTRSPTSPGSTTSPNRSSDSAAGYIVGAAAAHRDDTSRGGPDDGAPTVAVSMNGNTTMAMDLGRARLEKAGYAVVTFHANGVGGRALEAFVESGRAAAVLDYTTTELGAGLVGGLMDAGPTRMETAGRKGIPQVLVPGCVDFITCGTLAEAEQEFPGRVMFGHNPELTLVRLREDEMAELGAIFAAKANLSTGPTSVLVPKEGFSVSDVEGGPFWDPEADGAFIERPARQPRFPDPGPGDRRPHQRRGVRRRRRRRAAGPGRRRRRPKGPGSRHERCPGGSSRPRRSSRRCCPPSSSPRCADLRAIASRDLPGPKPFAAEHGIPRCTTAPTRPCSPTTRSSASTSRSRTPSTASGRGRRSRPASTSSARSR